MKKLFITFGVFLLTSLSFAQLSENFEGGIPVGWTSYNNAHGSNQWTTISVVTTPPIVCEGTVSAYVNGTENIGAGNTSEKWLVSSQVTVPANGQLLFSTRSGINGLQNTTYQIRVSTVSQTSGFQIAAQWSEAELTSTFNICEDKAVDLSFYAGQNIYIAFVMLVNQSTASPTGDRWSIDNVRLVKKCEQPELNMINYSMESIEIGWLNPSGSTEWELKIFDSSTETQIGSTIIVTSNPYLVTGLSPNTFYHFYLRAICELNTFSAPIDFHAKTDCQNPRNLGYNHNGTEVTVSWEALLNTQWEVEIAESDQNFTGNGITVNTNSHTFVNLDPNKFYQVQVRSLCSSKGVSYTSGWEVQRCIKSNIQSIQESNSSNKDLCVNEVITFSTSEEIVSHNWRFYDSNNNLLGSSNLAEPTFVFSQVGSYYCLLEATGNKCNDLLRHDFEIKQCFQCIKGKIVTAKSLCLKGDNYFTFSPDSPNAVNYSDPNLSFQWSVTDSNGDPVLFEPIYLFGSALATYIKVPFANDGEYTIRLTLISSGCTDVYEESVIIRGCPCKEIGGVIKVKEDKVCVGKEFSLYFSEPQEGYTYDWTVLNSSYQIVSSGSGASSSIIATVNQTGEYRVILTVRDRAGCKYLYFLGFKAENCEGRCILGFIGSDENHCIRGNNYFHFVVDPSTPIDFSDPDLSFEWSVEDSSGNSIPFEPIFLFGGSLAYYVNVRFEGESEYTIRLSIRSSRCEKEVFKKTVRPERCDCKGIAGTIKPVEEKICVGKSFSLQFSEPETGYTYDWTILNSNHQVIYSIAGNHNQITTLISQTGEYEAILIVRDQYGCEQLYTFRFKVENCDNRCILGNIAENATPCIRGQNYFWFVPDANNPIDYSDPSLQFEWSVTDSNGHSIPFETINLFGSSFPYYIVVPFETGGVYTISLSIITSECSEKFEKTITVTRCGCLNIRGEIKIREEKICLGRKFSLYFETESQFSYNYSWNILNSTYQSIYSSSGNQNVISTTINQPGSYLAILTITDQSGCQFIYLLNFKVENCEGSSEGECLYHLAFSFATPNGTPLNNEKRLAIGKGIVDFVNNNVNGKLFVTSVDDHQSGSRFSARQSNVTTVWNQPFINGSSEINAFNSVGNSVRLRIQNDNYPNTTRKLFDFISDSQHITMPIDINFVIISRDSNTSDIINSYNDLLSSGKVNRVFFILFEGGSYNFNGQSLTGINFLAQVINATPVNYSQTNSVLNSNYFLIPNSIHQSEPGNISSYINSFLQNAYNELNEVVECDTDCLNGEINNDNALCAGTDNFFWFSPSGTINFTDPELSFSWSVTHNGNPIPFETIDSNNTAINLSFASSGNYNIVLVVSNATCSQTIVKNVTIGNCSTGSCGDPTNQYYIIGLFKDLLKHLKDQPFGTITNGYSCAELIALLPYINPSITNPAIYNFTNSSNTISFSFSSNASSPHVVFNVPPTNPNLLISLNFGGNYININNQTNFISNFFAINGFLPMFVPVSGSSVSQINFCPDELNCVNHIAIVLDESTSITSVDAGRIRRQLKNFIEQQVVFNQTMGSQLRVSLIGLSDEDQDTRTDHVINLLVNQANKQTFINWINKYKNRYNQGLSGVSSNSDYWNSGLFRAAQTDASLVILMTDGAQTGNLNMLQNTIGLYNNGGNSNSNKHLHVIGLTNGYYIDGETNAGRYGESFNPNLVKEVFFEEDDVEVANVENNTLAMRLTDFLRISLRYLIYGNTQFPIEADLTQANYFSTDYSGHFNFKFLYDDPFFLSNGLFDFLESTCGERQYLEKCDDCYGVQLDIKKNYILSAWVHVDKMQQVISFKEETQSPSIEIKFTDEGQISLPTVTDGGIVYPGSVELFPQGNIIDGWQRIFGSFSVHPDTVFLEITLKNGSFSDAMLFDDIRIHPRDGSMKSFIYDEQNYRLMSELDENNYSTYYEYDAEGGLVRVKKETERGVKTIQESRSGSVIKN